MSPTFSKAERLNTKKVIEKVFEDGITIKAAPFILKYKTHNFEEGAAIQIAISVPKKRVPRAVDRNRLKRQIREAYRLNKADLLSQFNKKSGGLALFLIYNGEPKVDYHFLEDKIKVLLHDLQNKTK